MPGNNNVISRELPKVIVLNDEKIDFSMLDQKCLAKMSEEAQRLFIIMLSNVTLGRWTAADYAKMRISLGLLENYMILENTADLAILLQEPKEKLHDMAVAYLPPSADREQYIADGKVQFTDIVKVVKHIGAVASSSAYDCALSGIDRRCEYSEGLNYEISARLKELDEIKESGVVKPGSIVEKAYLEFEERLGEFEDEPALKGFVDTQRAMIVPRLKSALTEFRGRKILAVQSREKTTVRELRANRLSKLKYNPYTKTKRISGEQ